MKKIAYLLSLLLMPLLVACGDGGGTGDEPDSKPEVNTKRTVLVYMASDNSLNNFVAEDLQELKDGLMAMTDTRDMHLLVYLDMNDVPRLMELKKGKNQIEEVLVRQYEDRNSCGVRETQQVFEDAFHHADYEAGSYGLVYWSHGDGWIPAPGTPSTRWIGQDTGSKPNGYMNISDLADILKTLPHMDFIMFDACFMHSIEVAYALREYTDYYIGSPTENPGPGAPYDVILPYMFRPGAASQIAAAYFSIYEAKYKEGVGISNSNWTGGTAIGVLKSSELEALALATRSALQGVSVNPDLIRQILFDYDQRNKRSSSHTGYYDFVELMQRIVTDANSLNAWRMAYNNASVFWATTPKVYSMFSGMFSMEQASGVTHYIPTDERASVQKAYRQTEWYTAAGLTDIGF